MAIFLSYSRHDEVVVKTLASGLEAAHRQVWIDNDLGGGDAWWDRILAEIRDTSVFVFALSDNSLGSKPCIAELGYAEALGRPILPVQVGPVGIVRANPLYARQTVNYRPDEANSGFEVLDAIDAAIRRVTPLPDPLPPEPPIPFAYLQGLSRDIDSTELSPGQQVAVVDQLRKALGDESEESVRTEILAMLGKLRTKPWATRRTDKDIEALLYTHSPTAQTPPEHDSAPHTPPVEQERQHSETSAADAGSGAQAPPRSSAPAGPAASPSPAATPKPDGRAIFEQRMAELAERQRAEERRRGEEERRRGIGGTGAAGPSPGAPWKGVSTPIPEPTPMHATPPTGPPTTVPPAAPAGPQLQPHERTSPPNYWGLSIVAFLLSLAIGAAAMYFSYQVGQLYQARDYEGAQRASRNAKNWGIAGLVVGVLIYSGVFRAVA